MTIQVGDRLPDVPLSLATAEGPQADHQRRIFRRQAGGAVRRAGRLHPDLLGAAPALLCRQGAAS